MKTQIIRTATEVIIDGTPVHFTIPEQGRNDIYLLRHAMGYDLAISDAGITMSTGNPDPGTFVSLAVAVENRGDLPADQVRVEFYDGNPAGDALFLGSVVIPTPLIAGTTRTVGISWLVPGSEVPHVLYAVVDPAQKFDDRDRANNTASRATLLPDLVVDTILSSDVGNAHRLVIPRITNAGAIPSGPFMTSVRVGAPTGEVVFSDAAPSLVPGGTQEFSFLWDTDSFALMGLTHAVLFVQVDSEASVMESDETNNTGLTDVDVNFANTATPTPTPTSTATYTPTNTATNTPTNTFTRTPTPTWTATPFIPTNTFTNTPTPSPTVTDTPTPSPTPSATPSPTPSATPLVSVVPDWNHDGTVDGQGPASKCWRVGVRPLTTSMATARRTAATGCCLRSGGSGRQTSRPAPLRADRQRGGQSPISTRRFRTSGRRRLEMGACPGSAGHTR